MEMSDGILNSTEVLRELDGFVYVIDDDSAIRDALLSLIGSVGWHVAAYPYGHDFLVSERPEHPSCLLLDVRLRGLSGFSVLDEMRKRKIGMPVIFMTAHGDVEMSVRAMKEGAFDFLLKPFREQELIDSVGHALRIDRRRLAAQRSLSETQRLFDTLTPRQRDVMALIVDGLVTKQIAARLNISEITIKIHRKEVMAKMQARSIAELVIKAAHLGLHERQLYESCDPEQFIEAHGPRPGSFLHRL
jgi:FixJ family two-component response regulator